MSVSVVIPAYNRARRLPAAIESVLRQQQEVEIVVVDDGSTDDTRAVAGQYGEAVKYVYQANAGVGAARNVGIRHATREYVAFLDSDDRWLDFKLDVQLALFDARPDVGLVFSDFVIEKPEGAQVPGGASIWAGRALDFPDMARLVLTPAKHDGAAWPAPAIECWAGPMYRQLLDELPILTSSVIVRRSALGPETWYAERVPLFEDWEFFAQVARGANVGFVSAPTAVNVGHEDPGRVSKCSALDRAVSYLTLLERVWLADPGFAVAHAEPMRSAHGRALLAVAREALLAGRQRDARRAMAAWRAAGFQERRAWAAIYGLCSGLPVSGGRTILRNVLRGRAAARLVTGTGKRTYGSVNPAA